MANGIIINGSAVVYNNAILYINGSEYEINGYIQGIQYDTGTQSEHIQTLTEFGDPIGVNPINDAPTATISFAPGAFLAIYSLMNTRFTPFSLTIEEYTTGNLDGNTHTLQIIGALPDGNSGNIGPQQAASTKTMRFKATKIVQ